MTSPLGLSCKRSWWSEGHWAEMLGSVARICCYPLVSVCEGLMEILSRESLNQTAADVLLLNNWFVFLSGHWGSHDWSCFLLAVVTKHLRARCVTWLDTSAERNWPYGIFFYMLVLPLALLFSLCLFFSWPDSLDCLFYSLVVFVFLLWILGGGCNWI